jgi:hypothetical protein
MSALGAVAAIADSFVFTQSTHVQAEWVLASNSRAAGWFMA